MSLYLHNDLQNVRDHLVYLSENHTNSANLRNFLGGIFELTQRENPFENIIKDDVHLIFNNLFNSPGHRKYYDLPDNNIQPNFVSFQNAVGFKIVVDLSFTLFDPQIFDHLLTQDALYKKETIQNLKHHPFFGGGDKFDEALEGYLKKVAASPQALKLILDDIAMGVKQYSPNIIVVPIICLSSYLHSGVLLDDRFLFVSYDHLVHFCVDDVSLSDKDVDVFFSGSALSFVYPYRSLIRNTLQWQKKAPFTFYDDYPTYISQYIIPRTKKMNEMVLTENPAEWQEINKKLEVIDIARYDSYLKQISKSRISICCSSIFGLPLKKFIESLAMGSVVVGDLPKFPEDCGIIDGVNAIQCSIDDLEKTITSLLSDENKMSFLIANGLKLVKNRYTPQGAAKTFFSKIVDKIISESK